MTFPRPKNYVTLLQLKERREQKLKKEQEEKREKEEEERRIEQEEKREKEEEERRIEEQRIKEEQEKEQKEKEEERLRLQILSKSQQGEKKLGVSLDRRPYRRNFQRFSEKCYRIKEKNDNHQVLMKQDPKLVVDLQDEIPDTVTDENRGELKQKKKKKLRIKKSKKLNSGETTIVDQNEGSPSELVEISMKSKVEIGVSETSPPLGIVTDEKIHEKGVEKKNSRRIRRRQREKQLKSKNVEAPMNLKVEIEKKTEDLIGKSPQLAVNLKEAIDEQATGKLKTQNGIDGRKKNSSTKQAKIPINQTVEIEREPQGIEKSTSIEVNKIHGKLARKKTTRNGIGRWERKPLTEQVMVLSNPTVEIEQKIGDLTINDDKKKSPNNKKNGVYQKRMDFRKSGYRRKRLEAAGAIWVRKDDISGELSDHRQ